MDLNLNPGGWRPWSGRVTELPYTPGWWMSLTSRGDGCHILPPGMSVTCFSPACQWHPSPRLVSDIHHPGLSVTSITMACQLDLSPQLVSDIQAGLRDVVDKPGWWMSRTARGDDGPGKAGWWRSLTSRGDECHWQAGVMDLTDKPGWWMSLTSRLVSDIHHPGLSVTSITPACQWHSSPQLDRGIHHPALSVTFITPACPWLNIRENRKENHEWTIQRHWQHWTHKTEDEEKQNKNAIQTTKKMSNTNNKSGRLAAVSF
jgi:hypothetical protein